MKGQYVDSMNVIKENVWEEFEVYYNTGTGYVFSFDGSEEGNFWIHKTYRPASGLDYEELEFCSRIPLEHVEEFNNFTIFVKKHIKEWQESPAGIKRLKEIKDGTGYNGGRFYNA